MMAEMYDALAAESWLMIQHVLGVGRRVSYRFAILISFSDAKSNMCLPIAVSLIVLLYARPVLGAEPARSYLHVFK